MNSIFTQEQRDEIKFQNARAMQANTPANEPVDQVKPHDLTKFNEVFDGLYGLNMKARLGYNLNFIAQRLLRDALRAATNTPSMDESLSDMLSDEDLSEMFGFETAPIYTVDETCHWMMVTFLMAHDVAAYTEANAFGVKSRPYAWVEALIKTPVSLLQSDAEYRVKASNMDQRAQLAKLEIKDETGMVKFNENQKAVALESMREKLVLVKAATDFRAYRYSYSTEDVRAALAEMIARLGLNIPAILTDIASKYKESLTKKVTEGQRLGDVDERVLEFLPKKSKVIGTRHAEGEDESVLDRIEAGANFDYTPGEAQGGVDTEAVAKALKVREALVALETKQSKPKRVRIPKDKIAA